MKQKIRLALLLTRIFLQLRFLVSVLKGIHKYAVNVISEGNCANQTTYVHIDIDVDHDATIAVQDGCLQPGQGYLIKLNS